MGLRRLPCYIVSPTGSSWLREDVLTALMAAGVVCAPVNSLVEVMEEPHNWENGYLAEVVHPAGEEPWAVRQCMCTRSPAFSTQPTATHGRILGCACGYEVNPPWVE